MSQLKYDITEFALKNKEEILHCIEEQTSHLYLSERIFSSYPEMFHDLLNRSRRDKLKELIQLQFNLNGEQAHELCDEDFNNLVFEDL